jgi:MOSC domain-containing protein YiiM
MRLASVNIGRPKELIVGGRSITTGIYKRPVLGTVHVGRLGLDGDTVVDGKVHGGPDQAVYVYGSDDYEWWSFRFGRPLEPGYFGENLTVDGLESADFAVGDRLVIGDTVVLEVSAPRMPCNTLAQRIGSAQFVKLFRDAERPGLYCRVVGEGNLRLGDPVAHQPCAGERVTMMELFRAHYEKQTAEATLRRFLAVPLAERVREQKQEQLAKLAATPT